MAAIDEKEFERWMKVLQGDIHGVQDRLDELNGRTRKNEVGIAEVRVTLETHGDDIEALQAKPKSHTSGIAAAAGGFAGGFIVVGGWLAEKFFR